MSQSQAIVILKVSNGAKIRNRYNQVPHLTQDTNGKVTNSQKTETARISESKTSQRAKLFYKMKILLCCFVPYSIYGYVETVSSPNHTLFLSKLDLAANQYFAHILSRVTTILQSGKEGEGA